MLIASLFIGPGTEPQVRQLAWGAMLVLVGTAGGSAVWFTILQKWVIGAFCPYCMITHSIGLLLTALVVWRTLSQAGDLAGIGQAVAEPAQPSVAKASALQPVIRSLHEPLVSEGRVPRGPGAEAGGHAELVPPRFMVPTRDEPCVIHAFHQPPGQNHVAYATQSCPGGLRDHRARLDLRSSPPPIGMIGVGLSLAGILALCQISFAPPAAYRAGEARDNKPAVDLGSLPMVGSPEAPYVVTLLFDYQCPHCQQLHFMLDEVARRYGGKLAFALCPTPLNTRCNPYIPRDVDAFKDSCELVKVGLAVWVAKREAFPAFNRWMFMLESGDRWRPRSLGAARAKAVEWVGLAKFEAAWADPLLERYLQASMRIFGSTVQSGNTAIPKVVFGSRWAVPQPNDADDLVQILQDSLNVPKP